MPLPADMSGRTLGHYKLLRQIGSGAMGKVYAAEDTRLGREVALKLLPPEMAADSARRHRFEREARAIAALNHPHIVTVYSVDQADGLHFIIMELLHGRPLSELIPRDGMALERVLALAVPLADAVGAAHQHGVTHRDLKPANVMVTDQGQLKVLDFGLAKLGETPLGGTEGRGSLAATMTFEGQIVGTVAYMSPEQAQGMPVDPRSDIFSLGVMLYEMVTGQLPFRGETPIALITAILRDTPRELGEHDPTLPRHLGRIVRTCLRKDPERRYQSAKDLRNELLSLGEEVGSAGSTAAPGQPLTTRRRGGWVGYAILLALLALYAIAGQWRRWQGSAPEDGRVPLASGFRRLTSWAGAELFPSLAPDGGSFVYASSGDGDWDIYLQRVGGQKPINLTEDWIGDDTQAAFSPDGRFIAFRSERQGGGIFVMGATGESVKKVTDFGFNPAWSPDGSRLVVSTEGVAAPDRRMSVSELWTVEVSTGERTRLETVDAVQPHWSPGGHRIAFWGVPEGTGRRNIWTVSADGGEALQLTDDDAVDWNPVWSPDGRHLYFASDRGGAMNLWRLPIDERTGAPRGSAEPVTAGAAGFRQHISFSADGKHLLFTELFDDRNIYRAEFDAETMSVGPPVPVTRGSMAAGRPDVSPDGEWVAFSSEESQEDIFVVRTDGSGRRQLTDDVHKDRQPRWSPDGSRIAFYSNRSGTYEIWTINPDGSRLEQLTDTPAGDALYPIWSPDGSRLIYWILNAGTVYVLDPSRPFTQQTPEELPPLAQRTFNPLSWSPDGRWVAGSADSAGVVLYSVQDREFRKLTDFGRSPVWVDEGRRLLFWDEGKIFFLDTAEGEPREVLALAPLAAVARPFGMGPERRSIYFARVAAEADVWIVDLD